MSTEDALPSATGDLYRIQVRLDSERQLGPISQSIAPSSSERRFLTIVEGSTTVRQLRDKIIKHIKRNYPDVSSLKVEGLQNSQCYDLDIRFLVKEVLDRLDTVIVVSNSGLPQRKKPGPKPKGSAPPPASQSASSVASTSSATSEKPKAAETSTPAKKPTEALKRKLNSSSDSSSSSSSSSDDGSASPAKKAKKDVKPATAAPAPVVVPTPEATPAPAGDGKKKKKKKQQQQATGEATTSASSEPAKKAPVKETPAKDAPVKETPVKEAPAVVNKKQKKKGPEAKKPEAEVAKEKAAAAPKKDNSKKDNSSDDKENHYLSKEERQKRLETLTSKDPKELSQEEQHEFEDLKKRQAAYQRQRDRRAAKAMASEALLNKDPSLAAKAAEILEHRKPGPKPKQKAQQE